jgi:hypothetical protein
MCPADSIGQTLLILKEYFVTLLLGRRPVKTWVFVANITDEYILGLDVLIARDAAVDLTRLLLRLGKGEVPLLRPEA